MTEPFLTREQLDIARRVCTSKQFEALQLYARGMGRKRIGLVLGIDSSSVKARIAAGLKKVRFEQLRSSGVFTLVEPAPGPPRERQRSGAATARSRVSL
jgi:DNA-binding NarL/FixJ family response regulator